MRACVQGCSKQVYEGGGGGELSLTRQNCHVQWQYIFEYWLLARWRDMQFLSCPACIFCQKHVMGTCGARWTTGLLQQGFSALTGHES